MARPRSACSTALWFVAALLLGAGPTACSGSVTVEGDPDDLDGIEDGDPSDVTPDPAQSPTDAPAALEGNCGIVCDALLALQCSDNIDCVSDCTQSFAEAGLCAGMLAEYVDCFAQHVDNLTCSVFPYQCDSAYSDFATCKLGG
jgi:hypothetical protein